VNDEQKPLELILARNLLSSISTPGFLVDKDNVLVFYNEAAGVLLGKRFEETGKLPAKVWGRMWGPVGDEDEVLPIDELPLTVALRQGRPSHASFQVQASTGERHHIEVSAIPLVATGGGFRGALAVFWPVHENGPGEHER
jgi:PAS domain-containing protein